jgi:hypothetical protein
MKLPSAYPADHKVDSGFFLCYNKYIAIKFGTHAQGHVRLALQSGGSVVLEKVRQTLFVILTPVVAAILLFWAVYFASIVF